MSDDEDIPELWKDKKKVDIYFEHQNNFFLRPVMPRKKHRAISDYGVKDEQWEKFLAECNEVLAMAYIPIWFWVIISFTIVGPFILLFIQRRKTRQAAKKLAEFVNKMNELCRSIRQKKNNKQERLIFELPLPSVPGVLVTAVFQERKGRND